MEDDGLEDFIDQIMALDPHYVSGKEKKPVARVALRDRLLITQGRTATQQMELPPTVLFVYAGERLGKGYTAEYFSEEIKKQYHDVDIIAINREGSEALKASDALMDTLIALAEEIPVMDVKDDPVPKHERIPHLQRGGFNRHPYRRIR